METWESGVLGGCVTILLLLVLAAVGVVIWRKLRNRKLIIRRKGGISMCMSTVRKDATIKEVKTHRLTRQMTINSAGEPESGLSVETLPDPAGPRVLGGVPPVLPIADVPRPIEVRP